MDSVEGPLLALTLVLMFAGLLGSVLPGLPGVTLIFLSALVYAMLTDFRTVGAAILVVLFIFAAIAFVADFVATSYGARRFGASNWDRGWCHRRHRRSPDRAPLPRHRLPVRPHPRHHRRRLHRRISKAQRQDQQETEPTEADWRRASHAAGGVLVGYLASAVIQGLLGLASVVVFVLAVLY